MARETTDGVLPWYAGRFSCHDRGPKLTALAYRAVSLLAIATLLASGCQCGLDTGALDDLECSSTEDCEAVPACTAGRCECRDGYCQVPRCEPACGPDQRCGGRGCECIDAALSACGPSCVRLSTDPGHCGTCDRPCRDGEVCQQGECAEQCDEGLQNCAGSCVDWLHDRLYCGNCETRCAEGDVCRDGECGACTVPADCDDGLDCTDEDCQDGECVNQVVQAACLFQGACVEGGARCGDGSLCAPCAGGCVVPPTTLTVSCDDTSLPGQVAVCSIRSDEGTVAACLSCTAFAGMTELLHEDFDDCDLVGRGWTVTGSIAPICPLEAPGALYPGTDASALEADDGDWTIERTVDTRDFETGRLCFDYGQRGADGSAVFLVSLNANGNWTEVFDGAQSLLAQRGPAWLTKCLQFAPPAAGNPNLGIRFTLDAADNKDVYLDNVIVDGWFAPDLPEDEVFADGFDTCDLAPWAVEDTPPLCPTEATGWAGRAAFEAMEFTSRLSRRATGAPLCEDLRLVFGYGNTHTDGGEQLSVDLDVDGAWELIWGNNLGAGPENEFTEIELNLAHIDPRARDNPDLGVRFTLASNGGANRAVAIDDVSLRGRSCEAAGQRAVLSNLSPVGDTGQTYSFTLTADQQITLRPVCTWAGYDTISGTDRVAFRNP